MASRSAEGSIDEISQNDKKVPEIKAMRRVHLSSNFLMDIANYFYCLTKNVKMGERLPMIQEQVYQVNDPMQMKLYLSECGKHLQRIGKLRDSLHFLEAAHAVELGTVADDVQKEITQLLTEIYSKLGHFRTELNFLCWELDLFGSNDSRAISCESKDGMLISKRDFNKGDMVFFDKPVVGYVEDSRIQCNNCTVKTLYAIPCMQCCAVFYCSVACQRNDNHYHQYECLGFQMHYLLLIENILTLRMLVKALDVLQQNLLVREDSLDKPKTVEQLWEVLLENHTHSADFLQVFQARTCDHFSDEKKVYHTLLRKVPQLMYFIRNYMQLLVNYEHCWTGFPHHLRHVFVESVLLRLLCLAESQACCFKYELAFDKTEYEEMLHTTGEGTRGSKLLDCMSISESNVSKRNQYYGLYRFQTEMKYSRTIYNTVPILLDHGAVAIRAIVEIKKGDTLIFMEGAPRDTAPLNVISMNPANVEVLPLYKGMYEPYTNKIKLKDQITIWLQLITEKRNIFTEDHFIGLLLLFDRFISRYQSVPKRPICFFSLFESTSKLEKIYHEARLIPMVLMQDLWMVRLMYRYTNLRAIKRENIENLVNYMYDTYYLD
ncbi:uncharacterized protein LOC128298729 [Anopheles moucheti]|uniref:uncharacterized protein LOC128298729 n=1 Tax=Anopheles moucheti TaxID=186751 RepID=UPI0022EFDA62|nr:uncharacterized protein LOC128298729 [Anopheles moucheti]